MLCFHVCITYSLFRFNLSFKCMHVVKCSAGNAKLKRTIDDMTLKLVSSYRIETQDLFPFSTLCSTSCTLRVLVDVSLLCPPVSLLVT